MQITFEGVHGNDTVYMDCLKSICGDTEGKSMVDLCSNLRPHTPKLGFKNRLYVDILERVVDDGEQGRFIKMNVLKLLNAEVVKGKIAFWDVSICSDGIEHFTKENGYALLNGMENKSAKQVLFTPLGEYLVDNTDNPEGHHSGWLPEDVPEYASIVFKNYHSTLGIGAFFFFRCINLEREFERVLKELKTKSWCNNNNVLIL